MTPAEARVPEGTADAASGGTGPALEVDGLTWTYPGATQPTLHGLSFTVGRGEVLGFLGPSGAGKSTTQKILTRLVAGYQGSVRALGRDLAAWPAGDYFEQIGVSFEMPNHYQKLSGLENLAFFRSLYGGETEDPQALLELVGLGPDARKRVSSYSKGMQMRLTFARALLNRPRILFLDEPTAGLDPANARNVKDIVRGLRDEGRAVLLTTHDMTVADELCDRVALLVDGRIIALDTPRQLKLGTGSRWVAVEVRGPDGVERREFPLDGLGEDGDFAAFLRRGEVETIHSREATLEDAFLALTGRNLQ